MIAESGIPFVTCGTARLRDHSRPYLKKNHKDIALFKKTA